jgi:hypothetical protein
MAQSLGIPPDALAQIIDAIMTQAQGGDTAMPMDQYGQQPQQQQAQLTPNNQQTGMGQDPLANVPPEAIIQVVSMLMQAGQIDQDVIMQIAQQTGVPPEGIVQIIQMLTQGQQQAQGPAQQTPPNAGGGMNQPMGGGM